MKIFKIKSSSSYIVKQSVKSQTSTGSHFVNYFNPRLTVAPPCCIGHFVNYFCLKMIAAPSFWDRYFENYFLIRKNELNASLSVTLFEKSMSVEKLTTFACTRALLFAFFDVKLSPSLLIVKTGENTKFL